MSTPTPVRSGGDSGDPAGEDAGVSLPSVHDRVNGHVGPREFRLIALGGIALLTVAYVRVLMDVTATVGGTRSLLAIAILAAAAATVIAPAIGPRVAAALGAVLGAGAFGYYLLATGMAPAEVLGSLDRLVSDFVTLATGRSLLAILEVSLWVRAFVPAPVFLSVYFALRRRWVLGTGAGGTALLFLSMTGDAALGLTLAGVLGGIVAVGFGELADRDGTVAQADLLAIIVTLVVVLSMTVSLVPPGQLGPVTLVEPEDQGFEGAITGSSQTSHIAGSPEPSPEVRFTVRSEEPALWRTGVYDRFTGTEWVRTGESHDYDGPLSAPEGETDTVRQTVIVEGDARTMPHAAHPVAVEGEAAENTQFDTHGSVHPDEALIEGDMYNVESAVITADAEDLREAPTEYPDGIEERYLQQPESTTEEFEEATAQIAEPADNPYDTAVRIQAFLESQRDYSLDVDGPDDNLAEEFLFEMEAGYCVQFATTMVQMLRAEEIPARYAVGYSTGQQVDENEWVVRGMNAHAWVEVYFPEHGWVSFDPTPAADRQDDVEQRLETARSGDGFEDLEGPIDTDRSEGVPPGGMITEEGTEEFDVNESAPENETANGDGMDQPGQGEPYLDEMRVVGPDEGGHEGLELANETEFQDPYFDPDVDADGADDEEEQAPSSPTPEENVLLVLALVIGVAAGAHRAGAARRISRRVGIRWQRTGRSPEEDVGRAWRRLERHLEERHRPRRPGETVRDYLDRLEVLGPVDERTRRVAAAYERATYGAGIDRDTADETVRTVDEIVREERSLRAWLDRR